MMEDEKCCPAGPGIGSSLMLIRICSASADAPVAVRPASIARGVNQSGHSISIGAWDRGRIPRAGYRHPALREPANKRPGIPEEARAGDSSRTCSIA
jgi:hypothetical protein